MPESATLPSGSGPLALRERVYLHLKRMLDAGSLKPGIFLDLNAISETLGISRTPLRDALIRLEAEGFVAIHPRRGVMVRPLDLEGIRNAYQILGALEAAAIVEASPRIGPEDLERMADLDAAMRQALSRDDFADYHDKNVAFHAVYIEKSSNDELRRLIRTRKERLYDFPRRQGYLRAWELSSVNEHAELLALLKRGDADGAARFVRDVHWSFSVQERFIRDYYFARLADAGAPA